MGWGCGTFLLIVHTCAESSVKFKRFQNFTKITTISFPDYGVFSGIRSANAWAQYFPHGRWGSALKSMDEDEYISCKAKVMWKARWSYSELLRTPHSCRHIMGGPCAQCTDTQFFYSTLQFPRYVAYMKYGMLTTLVWH
jgi:hypothetical protein